MAFAGPREEVARRIAAKLDEVSAAGFSTTTRGNRTELDEGELRGLRGLWEGLKDDPRLGFIASDGAGLFDPFVIGTSGREHFLRVHMPIASNRLAMHRSLVSWEAKPGREILRKAFAPIVEDATSENSRLRRETSAADVLVAVRTYLDGAEDAGVIPSLSPEALPDPKILSSGLTGFEGATQEVTVNRRERNPALRRACLASHGVVCAICSLDFGETFGPEFAGLVHVHHLKPAALGERETAAETDLIPVCPNCHTMLHYRRPWDDPRSIEELRAVVTPPAG